MDKYSLLWDGRAAGELTVEQEALYTWFEARCRLPGEGLWCAWVAGEGGELRLGVLEPAGEEASIRRRFSRRMTEPLGRLLQGELRPAAGEDREAWETVPDPAAAFRSPWVQKRLRGIKGALLRRGEDSRRYLALPYDRRGPFPLTTLFCFACIRHIGGKAYAVFAFDGEETPVFPG